MNTALTYINEKIINDAKERATGLVNDARKKAAERIKNAKAEIKENEKKLLADAKATRDREASSREALAALEVRNKSLGNKQETLSKLFNEVKTEFINLPETEYKEFIKNLITENCRDGDTVIICPKDKEKLSDEFINHVSKSIRKKLSRKVEGNFEGGIILANNHYDLRLTVDELLYKVRKQNEGEIARLLWGE